MSLAEQFYHAIRAANIEDFEDVADHFAEAGHIKAVIRMQSKVLTVFSDNSALETLDGSLTVYHVPVGQIATYARTLSNADLLAFRDQLREQAKGRTNES